MEYNTKVTEIENKLTNHNHDKYIDTSKFNTLATNVFNARIVQADLKAKTDFDAKLSKLNRKITKNKSKHLLAENELNTLENKIPDVINLVKKQIVTLNLMRLILKYQVLMIKLAKLY